MKNRAYLVITNNTKVGRVLELDLDVIEERVLINLSNETLDDLIITEIAEEELKMFVEEIIEKLDELKAEGRVRDWDYYQGEEDEEATAHQDGFIWVDEIDKWVKVD